jgi:hypothetical protein
VVDTDVSYSYGNQRTHHYKDRSSDPNRSRTFYFMAPNPMLEDVFNVIIFFIFCSLFYDVCS